MAGDADRESRARISIHRMFAETCDPATDARLAANSIFLATGMDGPIKLAAERLLRDFSAALIAQQHAPQIREALLAYVGELRALTLARHASFWGFLIQAFAVSGAVDDELDAYLNAFAPKLDHPMGDILSGRFRQTASGDELIPWGGALSLLGQFWFPARERGVSESDLMSTMWASPQNWERVGSYSVVGRDEASGVERSERGADGEPFQGTLDEVRAFFDEYFGDIDLEPRTYTVLARRQGHSGSEEIELGRGAR